MRLTADFSRGMSMKYFAMATALLLFAVPAFAADVDGKWTGSVSTSLWSRCRTRRVSVLLWRTDYVARQDHGRRKYEKTDMKTVA